MAKLSKTESKKPGNIYDAFVKWMFSRVVVFADFLLNYADAGFVRNIDVDKIYAAPTHNIGLKGDERISDLVFACPLKHGIGTQKAVIVFEHAGSSLKKLPVRLHGYASAIWLAEIKSGAKILSALYFIVLRTGKKPCRRLTTLADWLPKDESGKPIGAVIDIPYKIVDLPAYHIDELTGSPELRLGFGILKKMTEGTEEEFPEALLPLLEIADEEKQVELTKELLMFVSKVFAARSKQLESEAVSKALKPIFHGQEKNMIPTIFEEKYLEGKAEGLAEGRSEGRAEGRAEGHAEAVEHDSPKWKAEGQVLAILCVLKARFGNVPMKLQSRLFKISDLERLGLLAGQAATCPSLKDFTRQISEK
ncbi:hypothetical protein FACS1894170_11590 [Planctomycetales bacterium]|nr:hypothetical protein FACS1894170_11590 [Planctomycetales bacterium]